MTFVAILLADLRPLGMLEKVSILGDLQARIVES